MTKTNTTPLRKLPAKWPNDRPTDPHTDPWMLGYMRAKRECADELQAALSARDEAGAEVFAGIPRDEAIATARKWIKEGQFKVKPRLEQVLESLVAAAIATPPAANIESVRRAIEDKIADMRCLGHSDWADLTNFVNAQFRRLAAVAPAGMNGWQPIETAPKDGTHVLLGNPAWIAANTGAYDDGEWRDCGFSFSPEPTHWQPLPTPPATAGQE